MTREEAIKVLHNALYGGGNAFVMSEFRDAIKLALGTLKQEREPEKEETGTHRSLPSNLDEAAGNYAIEVVPDRFVPDEGNGYKAAYTLPDIKVAFKAGAEWLAGQGITVECGVRVYPTLDEEPHPWVSLYRYGISCDSIKDIPELETLGFKDGDIAIVTIRKK